MIVQGDFVGLWISKKIGGTYISNGSISIGQLKNGELVNGVLFDNYNKSSIRAEIVCEGSISREFLRVILDYPFNIAKVNCIILTISSNNKKSERLAKHFGAKYVATIPLAMPDGDMLIYSLKRQDCEKFMR